MDPENNSLSEQEARFQLRKSFLEAIIQLKGNINSSGSPCKILTYEQSNLEATFAEWNPDGSEMLVTDLITPANIKMETALLRIPDILSISFQKVIE